MRHQTLYTYLILLAGVFLSLTAVAEEIRTAQIRPESGSSWEQVHLPDHWSDSRPQQAGAVWYRLNVPIARPSSLLGIYIKRACNNVWIYANGQLLYSGGGPLDGARVRRNCYFPVLASWPQQAQKMGNNELLIRLHSDAASSISSEQRKGHLSAVIIDRWQLLLPIVENENRIRITLPRITCALMAFSGLTMLVLWWRYRREPVYLNFGITMTAGALGTARVFVSDPGIDNLTVERIVPALALLICLGISGCLIELNEMRSRFRRLWWMASLILLFALAIIPSSVLWATALFIYGFGATCVAFTLYEVIRHLHKDSAEVQKVFYLTSAIMLAIGIHDYLIQIRILTYTDRPLIQVALPILLLGLMMRLLSRHAEALATAENAKKELEDRVSIITREIERSYQESVDLQREHAARDERERIARDLHDDLGARLLTLVHRSHDEKASESAREALSDLRLLIGHLNQPEGSLEEAVSDWRAETHERCEAAGRELQWQSIGLNPHRLGTRQKITLGRILRESVTNSLKHTDSPVVAITIKEDGVHLHMEIRDSASSLPVTTWRTGTGMRNLEMRAQQIGAHLEWHDIKDQSGDKAGTSVQVLMPISALNSDLKEAEK